MKLLMTSLGLIAFGILACATPANAASPYAGYDNSDPSTSGCSANAFTYWTKDLLDPASGAKKGTVELRVSRTCATNWVRVNSLVTNSEVTKTLIRPKQYLANETAPYGFDQTVDNPGGGITYGMQLYAPAGVCVQVGAVIRLNGAVVANSGQSVNQVC